MMIDSEYLSVYAVPSANSTKRSATNLLNRKEHAPPKRMYRMIPKGVVEVPACSGLLIEYIKMKLAAMTRLTRFKVSLRAAMHSSLHGPIGLRKTFEKFIISSCFDLL